MKFSVNAVMFTFTFKEYLYSLREYPKVKDQGFAAHRWLEGRSGRAEAASFTVD